MSNALPIPATPPQLKYGTSQRAAISRGDCVQCLKLPARPGKLKCHECNRVSGAYQATRVPHLSGLKCSYCRKPGHFRPRCEALASLLSARSPS